MATRTSPDPVAEAQAYQRHLLSLLGDDDPATVQSETERQISQVLAGTGTDLRTRPAPKEWSVLELLGHLTDAELVMSARYRWALSHDQPPLLGYDQDAWVERLRHNDDDPAQLLATFAVLRSANIQLWNRSTSDERARVAMHAERGPESYDLMFRMIAGHDRFHLEQMRRTQRQVQAAR